MCLSSIYRFSTTSNGSGTTNLLSSWKYAERSKLPSNTSEGPKWCCLSFKTSSEYIRPAGSVNSIEKSIVYLFHFKPLTGAHKFKSCGLDRMSWVQVLMSSEEKKKISPGLGSVGTTKSHTFRILWENTSPARCQSNFIIFPQREAISSRFQVGLLPECRNQIQRITKRQIIVVWSGVAIERIWKGFL